MCDGDSGVLAVVPKEEQDDVSEVGLDVNVRFSCSLSILIYITHA